MVVTVGDVTVIITDYKPKPEATRLDESATSENMSFHESSDTDFSEWIVFLDCQIIGFIKSLQNLFA